MKRTISVYAVALFASTPPNLAPQQHHSSSNNNNNAKRRGGHRHQKQQRPQRQRGNDSHFTTTTDEVGTTIPERAFPRHRQVKDLDRMLGDALGQHSGGFIENMHTKFGQRGAAPPQSMHGRHRPKFSGTANDMYKLAGSRRGDSSFGGAGGGGGGMQEAATSLRPLPHFDRQRIEDKRRRMDQRLTGASAIIHRATAASSASFDPAASVRTTDAVEAREKYLDDQLRKQKQQQHHHGGSGSGSGNATTLMGRSRSSNKRVQQRYTRKAIRAVRASALAALEAASSSAPTASAPSGKKKGSNAPRWQQLKTAKRILSSPTAGRHVLSADRVSSSSSSTSLLNAIALHPCLLQMPNHRCPDPAACPYVNIPADICLEYLRTGSCRRHSTGHCPYVHEDPVAYTESRISEKEQQQFVTTTDKSCFNDEDDAIDETAQQQHGLLRAVIRTDLTIVRLVYLLLRAEAAARTATARSSVSLDAFCAQVVETFFDFSSNSATAEEAQQQESATTVDNEVASEFQSMLRNNGDGAVEQGDDDEDVDLGIEDRYFAEVATQKQKNKKKQKQQQQQEREDDDDDDDLPALALELVTEKVTSLARQHPFLLRLDTNQEQDGEGRSATRTSIRPFPHLSLSELSSERWQGLVSALFEWGEGSVSSLEQQQQHRNGDGDATGLLTASLYQHVFDEILFFQENEQRSKKKKAAMDKLELLHFLATQTQTPHNAYNNNKASKLMISSINPLHPKERQGNSNSPSDNPQQRQHLSTSLEEERTRAWQAVMTRLMYETLRCGLLITHTERFCVVVSGVCTAVRDIAADHNTTTTMQTPAKAMKQNTTHFEERCHGAALYLLADLGNRLIQSLCALCPPLSTHHQHNAGADTENNFHRAVLFSALSEGGGTTGAGLSVDELHTLQTQVLTFLETELATAGQQEGTSQQTSQKDTTHNNNNDDDNDEKSAKAMIAELRQRARAHSVPLTPATCACILRTLRLARRHKHAVAFMGKVIEHHRAMVILFEAGNDDGRDRERARRGTDESKSRAAQQLAIVEGVVGHSSSGSSGGATRRGILAYTMDAELVNEMLRSWAAIGAAHKQRGASTNQHPRTTLETMRKLWVRLLNKGFKSFARQFSALDLKSAVSSSNNKLPYTSAPAVVIQPNAASFIAMLRYGCDSTVEAIKLLEFANKKLPLLGAEHSHPTSSSSSSGPRISPQRRASSLGQQRRAASLDMDDATSLTMKGADPQQQQQQQYGRGHFAASAISSSNNSNSELHWALDPMDEGGNDKTGAVIHALLSFFVFSYCRCAASATAATTTSGSQQTPAKSGRRRVGVALAALQELVDYDTSGLHSSSSFYSSSSSTAEATFSRRLFHPLQRPTTDMFLAALLGVHAAEAEELALAEGDANHNAAGTTTLVATETAVEFVEALKKHIATTGPESEQQSPAAMRSRASFLFRDVLRILEERALVRPSPFPPSSSVTVANSRGELFVLVANLVSEVSLAAQGLQPFHQRQRFGGNSSPANLIDTNAVFRILFRSSARSSSPLVASLQDVLVCRRHHSHAVLVVHPLLHCISRAHSVAALLSACYVWLVVWPLMTMTVGKEAAASTAQQEEAKRLALWAVAEKKLKAFLEAEEERRKKDLGEQDEDLHEDSGTSCDWVNNLRDAIVGDSSNHDAVADTGAAASLEQHDMLLCPALVAAMSRLRPDIAEHQQQRYQARGSKQHHNNNAPASAVAVTETLRSFAHVKTLCCSPDNGKTAVHWWSRSTTAPMPAYLRISLAPRQ